MVEIAY